MGIEIKLKHSLSGLYICSYDKYADNIAPFAEQNFDYPMKT